MYTSLIMSLRPGRQIICTGLSLLTLILFNCISLDAQTRQARGYLSQDGNLYRLVQTQHNNIAGNNNSSSVLYYDFTVPEAGAKPYLNLTARGGDGGKRWIKNLSGNTVRTGLGGQGALAMGVFKIGTGASELKPGSTLRVIVGQCGHSGSNCWGCVGDSGAGGGGGTGILYLPAGANENKTSDWIVLMVAAGGGGGQANTSKASANGLPGVIFEEGYIDVGSDKWYYSLKRHGGLCSTELAGAGGGTDTLIGDAYSNTAPNNIQGKGGFQWLNGKSLPIGGMGGNTANYGGYGFGGGGGGTNASIISASTHPGGGGGGYAGGFGGGFSDVDLGQVIFEYIGGGGGCSYINPAFVLSGTGLKIKNGTTDNPANGFVEYQLSATHPANAVISRSRGFEAYHGTQVEVLKSGDWTMLWQYDGNLVLYQNGIAKWASNTQNKGLALKFQGDGNLVIYQNGVAVWSSATADNQHNGKGGRNLVLLPEGSLVITDQDGAVIWRGH